VYEHRHDRLLPLGAYLRRVTCHVGLALALIVGSLFVGMLGYVHFEHLSWLDGFLNASMLLGGMGPVTTTFQTVGGKLFAGVYALYSGMVFLIAAGVMLAPVIHRVMHKFHLDEGDSEAADAGKREASRRSPTRR
jgi:hypothetical protein